MTQDILDLIRDLFTKVYYVGTHTYIYDDNGIQIDLISFLIALAVLTIVLTSLINTVRYRIGSGVSDAIYDKGIFGQRSYKNEENN